MSGSAAPAARELKRLSQLISSAGFLRPNGKIDAAGHRQAMEDRLPEHNAERDARWASTLEALSQYKLDHGTLPGDDTRSASSLRQWLGRQRRKAAAGGLTPVQVQALDRVDPDWRLNRSHLGWEDRLIAAALEFKATGQVPRETTEAGQWLTRQRSRMSAGKLSGSQLQALEESIPAWKNLDRIRWSEQARSLAQYVAGAARMPSSRTTDPEARRLYVWLARQRQRLRDGILAADRAAELDTLLPGWRR